MTVRRRRYSKEKFAWRGEIYERAIKPLVEPHHAGKIVAIYIETGAWEMNVEEILAGSRRLSDHASESAASRVR